MKLGSHFEHHACGRKCLTVGKANCPAGVYCSVESLYESITKDALEKSVPFIILDEFISRGR